MKHSTAFKPLLFIILPMVLSVTGMAQTHSFTVNFAIPDSTYKTPGYSFSVTIKDSAVITITTQQILTTTADVPSYSTNLNNIDSGLFYQIVVQHLNTIIVPDTGKGKSSDTSSYVNASNPKRVASILQEQYKQYLRQKEQANVALTYGSDKYYGLSDAQKDSLRTKTKELGVIQEKKYYIKHESPHNCFGLLGIKFGNTNNSYNHYLDSAHYKTYVDSIHSYKREIKRLNAKRKFQAALIGSANVVTSFKIADQSQINGGFGLLIYKPDNTEFMGVFTISQANDTITAEGKSNADFGSSVLVPGVRRFSLLTSYRKRQIFPSSPSIFWKRIGIAWNMNVTPYNWELTKIDNNRDSSLTAKVMPLSMDLMFPFNWVNIYGNGQDIEVSTDAGFTGRYIMGNTTPEIRQQFLNSKSRLFGGFIAGINVKFNGLRFQFHVPVLFGKVNGLTQGQAYASMAFIANIVGANSIQSLFKNSSNDN